MVIGCRRQIGQHLLLHQNKLDHRRKTCSGSVVGAKGHTTLLLTYLFINVVDPMVNRAGETMWDSEYRILRIHDADKILCGGGCIVSAREGKTTQQH